MRIWIQPIFLTVMALSFGGPCLGDTLTLKNGDIVEGTYLGGTSRVLRMEVNGRVQTYDVGMVTGLQFTNPAAVADNQPSRTGPPPPKSDYPSSSDRPAPPRQYRSRSAGTTPGSGFGLGHSSPGSG